MSGLRLGILGIFVAWSLSAAIPRPGARLLAR